MIGTSYPKKIGGEGWKRKFLDVTSEPMLQLYPIIFRLIQVGDDTRTIEANAGHHNGQDLV